MNKMVINHLEKLFVTSDASTIVTEMDVYHPAAKLLVMAAKAQAGEVGDATNLVRRLQGRTYHMQCAAMEWICSSICLASPSMQHVIVSQAGELEYSTKPVKQGLG
jgi:hypothetical protein